MSTLIGAQMDNYRIIEKIGEGGMGAVYRAVDVMLERDVALKFLRPELSREPELVQRFRAEAVLLARLNHHFIAPIFGLHRYGEELFIAMEYVPGDTLDARLKRLERFSPDAAMHVTSMVLQALDYAHRLGVIHRDIKPGNVILTPAGTVKVMDFGIARVLGAERRTRAGAIVGTIAYMAPEQIQGLDTDQRADLYSVGTLLYEMLSGHVPFTAETDWALMQAQIATPPPPLRQEIELPDELETVVMRALEKTPEKRYQNAAEFQLALELVARQPGFSGAATPLVPGATLSGTLASPSTGIPHVASWEETRVGFPGAPASGVRQPLTPPAITVPPTTPPAVAAPGADATRLAAVTPPPAPPPQSPSAPTVLSRPPAPPVPPAQAIPAPPAEVASAPTVLSKPPAVPAPPGAAQAAKPTATAPKRGSTTGLIAAAAVALLAVVGGGLFLWSRSQTPPTEAVATNEPVSEGAPASTVPEPVQPVPPASASASPAAPGAAKPASTQAPGPGTPAGAKKPPTPGATTPVPSAVPPPGSTSISEAPPPPPPSRPAPPAGADEGPVEVFKDVRLIRRAGPEVDVELHFGPKSVSVTNQGGRAVLHSIPYSGIASAEYHESRHRRMLVRTTRHWLLVKGREGGGVLLRLDRDGVKPLLTALEQHLGRPVTMLAPEAEKEEK